MTGVYGIVLLYIGVGDCWSVALWWSVSYPASGLASIDEPSPANVSSLPKDFFEFNSF